MRHCIYLIPVLALIGACTPEKSDSASATDGSSSDGGSTDASPTSSTTTATSMTSATTATSATTDAETSGGGTGDGATGGSPDPDDMALCEAFCAKSGECGERPGGQPCMDACLTEVIATPGLCGEAERALLACTVAMTCREFLALANETELGPCTLEFEAKAQLCEGSGCAYEASGDAEGVTCQLAGSCSGAPPLLMACDAEMCTCSVGDNQINECAAGDACMDLEGLKTKGVTCCGFV